MKFKHILLLSLFLTAADTCVFADTSAYFTQTHDVEQLVMDAVEQSTGTIRIAIFTFTSWDLAKAVLRAKKRGVAVSMVMDEKQAQEEHSRYGFLKKGGINIKLVSGLGKYGIMHHKFAVFDSRLLLTGSYNWTYSANKYNYENTVFTDEAELIQKYNEEFDRLMTGR